MTPDRVWVSDWHNISLIYTATGNILYRLYDSSVPEAGIHTVNSDSELIYIDEHNNISKVAADMKTTTILIKHIDTTWKPRCVYFSLFSGDLLVGMSSYDTHTGMETGKVTRYNDSCRPTQTIPQNNTPHNLYLSPSL